MTNGWLTLQEASQHLNISKDLLYKLANTDKVPAYKIGRIWRLNKIELDSWVKNRKPQQQKVEKLLLFEKDSLPVETDFSLLVTTNLF